MEKINYGGLKIYSAANPDVQKVLNTVYSNRIAFDKEADTAEHPAAQSAATVMDYEGRIVGIVGQAGGQSPHSAAIACRFDRLNSQESCSTS